VSARVVEEHLVDLRLADRRTRPALARPTLSENSVFAGDHEAGEDRVAVVTFLEAR
jgi:hypothetical protein